MVETEKEYIQRCLETNKCPVCQQPIDKKVGSGRLDDGVFCSLNCYTEWNKVLLIRRHQERMQKDKSNERDNDEE